MPATKQTATEAYCDAHYDAACLLDRLTDLLSDLPHPDAEGLNWGHVGSLRHAIQQLRDVETHLQGMIRT